MNDKLTLAYNLLNTDFRKENAQQRLIRLGVDITTSPDEHDIVNTRQGERMFFYGFKRLKDYQAFAEYLMTNGIKFTVPEVSIGARYPYHIGLTEPKTKTNTSYTIESANRAVELITEVKTIMAKAQDYEKARDMRELSKYFTDKLEADKNRTI